MSENTQIDITSTTTEPWMASTSQSYAAPGQTWSTIKAANGLTAIHPIMVRLSCSTTASKYDNLYRSMLVFDMDSGIIPRHTIRITGATLKLKRQNDLTSASLWSTDSDRGFSLCSIDETLKTTVNSDNPEDYSTIYGGMTEYTTRVNRSTIAANDTWYTWTFNTAGIDYLNSVRYKALFTGYAMFGFVFGGEIDGATPLWSSAKDDWVMFYDADDVGNEPYLTITYEPICQINIGDVWKDVWEAYINIGDTWKDVQEIKVNVGDVWKELP